MSDEMDCSAITRQQNSKRFIDPSRPHPFKGARNETGHYGYVHDPCILLRHPPQLQLLEEICNATPGDGIEGFAGQLVVDQIIIFDSVSSPGRNPTPSMTHRYQTSGAVANQRIFCSIYTYPGGNPQTDAIRETWGKDCDGFLGASSETVASKATVDISHFGQPNEYGSIWNRVQSAMVYVYDNFRFDFDYFFFCGDDTFLIVENLRHFLGSEGVLNATEGNQPFHAGAWISAHNWKMIVPPGFYYNGGGGGYVLNRAALELVVHNLAANDTNCQQSEEHYAEDGLVALCLWMYGNVRSFDTTDRQGRHRFHHTDPETTVVSTSTAYLDWRRDQVKVLKQIPGYPHLKQMQDFGIETVSPETVSFHHIKPPHYMRRLYLLFHPDTARRVCPESSRILEKRNKTDIQFTF